MLSLLDELSQVTSVADYSAAIRRCMGYLGLPFYDASYVIDAPKRPPPVGVFDASNSYTRCNVENGVTDFQSSYSFPVTNSAAGGAVSAWHTVGAIPAALEGGYTDVDAIRRDPVIRHMRERCTPIVWSCDTYKAAGESELWEFQAAHGLRNGVAVAMHLPGGRHFRIGAESADPLARSPAALMDLLGRIQLLLVHANAAATHIYESPAGECPLTESQIVCLRWALMGKSAWETSRILGIAENTVIKHLHGARVKLNCSRTVQAAAIAADLGWI